jgi:uncharacterized protein YndB with AHSA1/START domain
MSDVTRITRTIETDLEAGELWTLVADGDGWVEWMVDDADIDMDPGAHGSVVDDGVARDVRIDHVDPSRRVVFTWWPHSRPDQASNVELVILPSATGSRLRITETYARASAGASSLAWDVRGMLLVVRALAAAV